MGIMVTGAVFCKLCTRSNLQVISTTEYPSLIRGGHNNFTVRASDHNIYSLLQPVNVLVALNQKTIDLHKNEVSENGLVIFDPDEQNLTPSLFSQKIQFIPVPFLKLAKENNGDALMRNTVSLGASCALLGLDFTILRDILSEQFKKKGQQIVQQNVQTAKAGFDFVLNSLKKSPLHTIPPAGEPAKMVLTGNESLALGAVSAGMKFFAAYPMTPINGLITFFASHGKQLSIVYKQPEDEISAINMAIGASFTGVRAMTASSGGGFALMNEALSMAGMTETPLVIVLGQRPGPSSGLPTWTTQGDLQHALHAGHGEFFRFVFTPGDVEEAFYLIKLAFNLAEQYQVPALILTDKYLSESTFCLEKDKLQNSSCLPPETVKKAQTISRGKIVEKPEQNYKRYEMTADGISPRLFPGQGVPFTVNSYEHNQKGLSTEIASEIKEMVEKRTAKYQWAEQEAFGPLLYGPEQADYTLVGWGTTKQAVLEALKYFADQKLRVNYCHFVCLSPFPVENTKKLFKNAKHLIDVENNSEAQLASLISEKTEIKIADKILKYDGRQFYPEEIINALSFPHKRESI